MGNLKACENLAKLNDNLSMVSRIMATASKTDIPRTQRARKCVGTGARAYETRVGRLWTHYLGGWMHACAIFSVDKVFDELENLIKTDDNS